MQRMNMAEIPLALLCLSYCFLFEISVVAIITTETELKHYCDSNSTRTWSESTKTCFESFSDPILPFTAAEQACAVDAPNETTGRLAHIVDNTSLTAVKNLSANGWVGGKRIIHGCSSTAPEDCSEIKVANPTAVTGIYIIKLKDGSCSDELLLGGYSKDGVCCVQVYCDMDRFGGGWTVFQKRQDGSVNFYRNWADYEVGFGSHCGEFYAGNKFIHYFTKRKSYDLLVELYQSAEKCKLYAQYSAFSIADPTDKYRLSSGSYVGGNAGDSLTLHSYNMKFSTYDQDNDMVGRNCAVEHKGAWWYKGCHWSNLNGLYLDGCSSLHADNMVWWTARGSSINNEALLVK